MNAEQLPVSVTVVCPMCSRPVVTRQAGNTTRCPKRSGGCGHPIPVPAGSTRPPVPLGCYGCGHQWHTRAREGGTVRCPRCRHPRRVPTGARDDMAPGTPRPGTGASSATAPAPEPRPAAPRTGPGFLATLGALLGRGGTPSAPTVRTLECLHCGTEWDSAAAPGNAVRCPDCRRMRRIPTGTAPAAGPRPAPRPPRPAPAPSAAPPAPAPRPADDTRRRDSVCALVRSLGRPLLVAYDTPPGTCEAMDTTRRREEQRCTRRAAAAVVYTHDMSGTSTAYACTEHARALAADAAHGYYVTATVRPLH